MEEKEEKAKVERQTKKINPQREEGKKIHDSFLVSSLISRLI
jgi:hypothetical protein